MIRTAPAVTRVAGSASAVAAITRMSPAITTIIPVFSQICFFASATCLLQLSQCVNIQISVPAPKNMEYANGDRQQEEKYNCLHPVPCYPKKSLWLEPSHLLTQVTEEFAV